MSQREPVELSRAPRDPLPARPTVARPARGALGVAPAGAVGFRGRAREFWRRYQHPEGLFWLRRVNHPLGALIALVLLPTRVTPNAVSVAGLVVHVAGALFVALLSPPVPITAALLVIVSWQLAFSLDCADGPLARARAQASAFGAWLDQLIDVASHAAVYTGLTIFLVRALALDGITSALLASVVVTLSLLQTFSTWQRQALIAGAPVGEAPSTMLRLVHAARHLVDYGAFLFLASVLLLWPPALLVFLLLTAVLNLLYVMTQIALNWRRHRRESRAAWTDGKGQQL